MMSPISADEFRALMAPLGPFEERPQIAVAVSGGADSTALALLADGWAREQGGRATALTVDHGLRPESAAEARAVGVALAPLAIAHDILTWTGDKPETGIQAAAREARYRLLEGWCRRKGVLHLLLAHHREDQAETVLLRLGSASGIDGLCGMPAIAERRHIRLLRPLLTVPGDRLRATLKARGAGWIDDPSNRNPDFQRVRIRTLMPALAGAGLGGARIAASARRLARARAALEAVTAELAAQAVTLHPAGFACVDAAALRAAPTEIGLRLLSQILRCIGGRPYPPADDGLERLYAAIRQGEGGTLGGCRVVPNPTPSRSVRGLLVCRETRGLQGPVAVQSPGDVIWDNRFRLTFGEVSGDGVTVAALGAAGLSALRGAKWDGWPPALPNPVLAALPAVYDVVGVCAVPHLGYNRNTAIAVRAEFQPPLPLAGAARCLV